jgi:hypothetical protein
MIFAKDPEARAVNMGMPGVGVVGMVDEEADQITANKATSLSRLPAAG